MKKWILILVLSLGIGIYFGSLAFAEENVQPMMDESQQQPPSNGGQGMMPPGGGPGGKGMGPMMGMMHKDSLVATSDGGVVVMQGPRILKYDKDLTLVKEVEIPRGKGPGPHEMNNDQAQTSPDASAPPPATS